MAMNFRLRKVINFSRFSKAGNTEIIQSITNRLLRIDAPSSGSKRRILIGRISPIFQGIPDSISYKVYSGSELFLLPEIGLYSLRFISSGTMKSGSVRFFEKIGQLSNTELREVQSLLGMVLEMASADTRNLIQSIEATSATIAADKAAQDATNAANAAAIAAAQAAANTANSGVEAVNTIATQISETMVINETFAVPMNAFIVQASGLYHAVLDLIKVDGTKGVQLSLTDADGDEQGFSQLISPYLGDVQKACVELTASQLTGNSYPLSFLCQGNKLSTVVGTPPVTPPTGGQVTGINGLPVNGIVQFNSGHSIQKWDDSVVARGVMQETISAWSGVSEARAWNDKVYLLFSNGGIAAVEPPDFVLQIIPQDDWTKAQMMGDLI